ncbi:MAG: chitinase, partial [Oscillospiraceae bacterium]|nr:chitinase [Oscillospiraceae bacterium]
MSYKVIGYAMNPSLSGITEEDVHKLTGINLAFGLIKDGLLDMRILPDIHLIEKYRAWNPDLKIVLSIGGWEAGGFSEMAMTAEGRKAFAQSC